MSIDNVTIHAGMNRCNYYNLNWYRSNVGCGDLLQGSIMFITYSHHRYQSDSVFFWHQMFHCFETHECVKAICLLHYLAALCLYANFKCEVADVNNGIPIDFRPIKWVLWDMINHGLLHSMTGIHIVRGYHRKYHSILTEGRPFMQDYTISV